MPWRVPREWEGDRAYILGGGPSLDLVDIAALKGRIIAVNDAGLIRAPRADVHYFADAKWFRWNRDEMHRFQGQYRVTRSEKIPAASLDIKRVRWDRTAALSSDPSALAGHCGGGNAINLAVLFGARRIVLFGFDMRPGRWHERHETESRPNIYADHFIPAIEKMAVELKRAGIEAINASPGSALTCFPIVHPDRLQ